MNGHDFLNIQTLARLMNLSENAVNALLRQVAADIVEPDIRRDIERQPTARRLRLKSSVGELLSLQGSVVRRAAEAGALISDEEWERLINGEG